MVMSNIKPMSLLLQLLLLGLGLASFTTSEDQFVYPGFASSHPTLDGAAKFMPNGLLDLTSADYRLNGHAFYPAPLRFRKFPNDTVQSFSIFFVFAIVNSILPSQGFAFFVAPSTNFSTAMPLQYFGLLNNQDNGNASNHIFAVEFDTIQNIDFDDINDNHVGIDVNSLNSKESESTGFYEDKNGTFRNLTLSSGEPMQVWVDYNGETTQISVTLAPLQVAKPVRPLASTIYNLSNVLVEPSYVGFSSASDRANVRHYVLGWSFGMNRPAPVIDTTKLPKLPRIRSKGNSSVLAIIPPIATAVFLLIFGTTIFVLVRRHRRFAEVREDWEVEFGPHRFSYKDLFHATEGFKNKNLLGIGGFGRVYKGVLPMSKLEVAVKRVQHEAKQGMKEFVAEVASIGRLQHRNIVQLLGYCRRKSEFLLVYDYMSNGSLDKYLHGEENKITLRWAQRFQIIKDIASSLLYLHEEWEKIVIHRDVKASNVLLDNEMNGRLGDFGLARLYDHGDNPQSTHVVGTIGYLAPELACTSKATTLTDIFAFGVFILEVTCGQRPIKQSEQENQLILVDWVLENWHKGLLIDTVDIKLKGDYDVEEAYLVLKLGLLCSHPFPDIRPSMRQVIQYLNGDMPLPEVVSTQLNYHMLALRQNEGFECHTMSYPSSRTSHGTVSVVSGGR